MWLELKRSGKGLHLESRGFGLLSSRRSGLRVNRLARTLIGKSCAPQSIRGVRSLLSSIEAGT